MYTLKDQKDVGLFNSLDELIEYVIINGVDPNDEVVYIDENHTEHSEGDLTEYIVL